MRNHYKTEEERALYELLVIGCRENRRQRRRETVSAFFRHPVTDTVIGAIATALMYALL